MNSEEACKVIVHLFLGCPAVKAGDELTDRIRMHQHLYVNTVPDDVTCQRCRDDNQAGVHHEGPNYYQGAR